MKNIKQQLADKSHLFRRVFSTDEGQKVLEFLKQECEPEVMFDENPHKTAYNCGKRDVVVYINQMMRYNDVNKQV